MYLGSWSSQSVIPGARAIVDRLREPDSTTLWYLQIGPEVEKIRQRRE